MDPVLAFITLKTIFISSNITNGAQIRLEIFVYRVKNQRLQDFRDWAENRDKPM